MTTWHRHIDMTYWQGGGGGGRGGGIYWKQKGKKIGEINMKMGGRGAKKVNLENWENLENGGVTLYPKIYNILFVTLAY